MSAVPTVPVATGSSSGSRTRAAAAAFTAAFAFLPIVAGGRTTAAPELPALLSDTLTASHIPGALVFEPPRPAPPQRPASAEAVSALRERTGLTWEEIARMFGVSRRTIHNWAGGAPVSLARERRLHQVTETIADFPVAAELMRSALRSDSGGRPIIDVIAMGAPDALIRAHLSSRVGPARTRVTTPPPPPTAVPKQAADTRQVNVRSLLVSGTLPHLDAGGAGDRGP